MAKIEKNFLVTFRQFYVVKIYECIPTKVVIRKSMTMTGYEMPTWKVDTLENKFSNCNPQVSN